jgi:hypothetical protein
MKSVLRAVIVVAVAIATTVAAAPRKVLVMPIDGETDPGTRTQINATIQKLARGIDGDVKVTDTSFADTAAAMGCDPSSNACADTVLTALAVDELVWGTAKTYRGKLTVVVKRATKGNVREQSVVVDPKSPEAAGGTLAPLFGGAQSTSPEAGSGSGTPESGSGSGSGSETGSAAVPSEPSVPWSHDKKLGVGLVAGGGVALIVGLALWANESSIQDQINTTPTPQNLNDINSLKSLEDKAASYALWGNVLVVAGLAVGGAGAYYLYRDHKNQATIAPVPIDHGTGAALVVGGRW